jgi:homoserine O-acetyltransferase
MRRGIARWLISAAFVFVLVGGLCAQDSATPKPETGEPHEFVIPNFKTESGVTLPKARVVYGTYGHLNAARDNVILLPSHYMADYHGYEWVLGAGHALDTSKLFLVATELFGNGHSSSPSNTPEPYHGPRFPVTTIRDNVEAVRKLLTEELHITHLRAIIGFSMGAQQAFQWAVSYPDYADRIVATAGTAKTYPHGYVRLEGQKPPSPPTLPFRRRLHFPTEKGPGSLRGRLDGVAVFSGVVAQGIVARRCETGHNFRVHPQRIPHELHPGRGCQ